MKKFGYKVDFNRNETLNQKLGNLITAPSVGVEDAGYIYFNTSTGYPYLWTGTIWLNLGTATSTVWRKSDGLTPADSYTEQIHHQGNVVLNGVARDNAYNNAFGSTLIVGTLGIQGTTITSENTTAWLTVQGNQGLRLWQINQNVGNIQIGKMTLGTMASNQTNDTNVSMGRSFTSSATQVSDPNWRNLTLNCNVNLSASTATSKTFHSIYIAPALTGVTKHYGLNMSGNVRFRNFGLGNNSGAIDYVLGVDSSGEMIETQGATGTFTTADGKTVTVTKGLITDITINP